MEVPEGFSKVRSAPEDSKSNELGFGVWSTWVRYQQSNLIEGEELSQLKCEINKRVPTFRFVMEAQRQDYFGD